MAKARPLVGGYLERISVTAFETHQREITDLVRAQHGVYALYKNDRLYYVGLAANLRGRIKQHLRDRHAGRWTRFSLYVVRKVDHIKEIESLLLRISDPAGNKQRGRLGRATNLQRELRRMMVERQRKELEKIFRDVVRAKRATTKKPGKTGKRKVKEAKRGADRPLKGLFGGAGKVIYATYKGKEHKAYVYANGRVRYARRNYDTPSAVAKVVVGRAVNGWTFWHFRKDGQLVPLSALRKK